MSDNWDEINRRAELVEVLTSIMERIYPVWVADTRAGELVEALEKWLDSRIENVDGGPADETMEVPAENEAMCATDGCARRAKEYRESGGVGAHYCSECATSITKDKEAQIERARRNGEGRPALPDYVFP